MSTFLAPQRWPCLMLQATFTKEAIGDFLAKAEHMEASGT